MNGQRLAALVAVLVPTTVAVTSTAGSVAVKVAVGAVATVVLLAAIFVYVRRPQPGSDDHR